ncbi:hypothetical protein [Congregibacter litoralis]|uniref:Uncharacterized protein n=1 Tax=Congregibacter litoralis KT71 TaxID=314285 RepID=A4A4I7_9GAMM|nr:hypothetical protein [Congregibacter litoralis]EAQ98708.2 hypothetical protein KT71_08782 [Congregibacter litoralis KT71]
MSAASQACLKGGDEVQQLLIARANYVEAHNQYRCRLKLAAYRVCDELQITPHFTELAKVMSVDQQQYNALAIMYWLHDYLNAQLAANESVRLASVVESLIRYLTDVVPPDQQGEFMQILIRLNSIDDDE